MKTSARLYSLRDKIEYGVLDDTDEINEIIQEIEQLESLAEQREKALVYASSCAAGPWNYDMSKAPSCTDLLRLHKDGRWSVGYIDQGVHNIQHLPNIYRAWAEIRLPEKV